MLLYAKKMLCVFGLMMFISACNQNSTSTQNKSTSKIYTGKNSIKYVCPMDADIVKDKPGICPKCGMKLVKK